jgi:hypothetical protein
MTGRSVTIEVPEYLYDRLKRRADEARLSIEAEVVQTLASTVPPDDRLEPELEDALAGLVLLDDQALWHRRAGGFLSGLPGGFSHSTTSFSARG